MKHIDVDMQAHLEGDVTTLCQCWIVERSDGVKIGFTDHDQDIIVDGVLCERCAGMESSSIEERTGLNVDASEVAGALQSDRITDKEIESGKYDNARVSTYVVNWIDPNQNFLDRISIIGEITREDGAFRFELRGVSALLDQTRGRHFVRRCQADLGDKTCKVDLADLTYYGSGVVEDVKSAQSFSAAGLENFAEDWFSGGRLEWLTGANTGLTIEVARHAQSGIQSSISLWLPMNKEIAAGDTFSVTAGCDKLFETCKAKFSNQLNFQGFPHIPGDGFASRTVSTSSQHDGGPIVP